MADLTGRCFCGQVTWRSKGPILWAGHCHCDSCRRATSSPFTSFFGVPREGAEFTGPLSSVTTSEGAVIRKFCTNCGSQVTYQFSGWPEETHLYAATLDDPNAFEPTEHYHYAEKLPWVQIDDDLVKYVGSAGAPEVST